MRHVAQCHTGRSHLPDRIFRPFRLKELGAQSDLQVKASYRVLIVNHQAMGISRQNFCLPGHLCEQLVEVKLVDSCCRLAYSIDHHNAGKALSVTPLLTISTNIGLAMGELFRRGASPALSRQTKSNKDSVLIEQNWYLIAHCVQGIEITFRNSVACKGQSENLAKFRMATRIAPREHLN